jgi:predicted alpha/beta hydrolase family esterase
MRSKKHSEQFIFIHSDNDPYSPLSHAEYLTERTDGELMTFEGQGHFNTEADPHYKQFPELLEIIRLKEISCWFLSLRPTVKIPFHEPSLVFVA